MNFGATVRCVGARVCPYLVSPRSLDNSTFTLLFYHLSTTKLAKITEKICDKYHRLICV